MITHIVTEQYGYLEVEYKDIKDFETNYPKHYLSAKRAQQKGEMLVREAKEKATPK